LRFGADRRLVAREHLAVAHQHPPHDHHRPDLVPAGGLDQVGHDCPVFAGNWLVLCDSPWYTARVGGVVPLRLGAVFERR
jgi:hypothetical protein